MKEQLLSASGPADISRLGGELLSELSGLPFTISQNQQRALFQDIDTAIEAYSRNRSPESRERFCDKLFGIVGRSALFSRQLD